MFSCKRRALLLAAAGATTGHPWARAAGTSTVPQQAAVWRALSRLGYGPTPALMAQLQQAGGARAWALHAIDEAWTASQQAVRFAGLPSGFDAPLPEIFQRRAEEQMARRQVKAQENPGPAMEEDAAHYSARMARQAAIWRLAACSRPELEHPLLARMTEFWFNHLNVSAGKGPVRPFVGHYLVHAIRAHALGRFDALLLASARHPAMLHYLDQAQSVAEGTLQDGRPRGLNENYARELMELHTLGVDSGYTQQDVRELARVLTGWTVGPRAPDGFRFAPRLHDRGIKTVLGRHFGGSPDPRAGEAEGTAAIALLAAQAATARRITLRLAQWFVADAPPPALLDQLARAFLSSGGDTRAVLRALVQSQAFWDAGNTLFKTPFDFACSALAATGGLQDERQALQTLRMLQNAGQAVLQWPTPDGYKVNRATWLAPEALTRRADYALALARDTPAVDFLADFMTPDTRQHIDAQPAKLRTGLLLAGPEFMSK